MFTWLKTKYNCRCLLKGADMITIDELIKSLADLTLTAETHEIALAALKLQTALLSRCQK